MTRRQWMARMVGPNAGMCGWAADDAEHRRLRRPALVRAGFAIDGEVEKAMLSFTAYGLVEAEINGRKVGEDILAPGWTVYDKRLTVWTHDVTELVRSGDNAMGFWLADGWYRGRIGFNGGHADCYGDRLGVFAQLEVTYADGRVETIGSNAEDGQWVAAYGPILSSGLYEGETYDARQERTGFSTSDYRMAEDRLTDDRSVDVQSLDVHPTGEQATGDRAANVQSAKADSSAGAWTPVEELVFDPSVLCEPASAGVRCIGEHMPVSVKDLGGDSWLVDFGQNCTQRIELNIPACEVGHTIEIHHAEVLEKDGSLGVRPLRRAVQIDTYISDGRPARWEPRFTIHGFRYARIDGWPGRLTAAQLTAHVYSSAMKRTGWFSCSNDDVNQLHRNIVWSMRSNFVSLPTDCPQRDERYGWTGDIAVFASPACFLADANDFLSGWLTDVALETERFGTVPCYVPYPDNGWGEPQALALWGDVTTMLPWAMWMADGDETRLAEHWPLACRWVDEVAGYLSDDGVWDRKPDVWCGQLGDWLDPTAPPEDAARAMTQKELVATAFFVHSARLVARMAATLKQTEAERKYEALAEHAAAGFRSRFVRHSGAVETMVRAGDVGNTAGTGDAIGLGHADGKDGMGDAHSVGATLRLTSDTQTAYSLAIMLDLLDSPADVTAAGDRLAELVRERGYKVGTGFAGTPYVLPALTRTGHLAEAYRLFLSHECPSWLYQVSMGATTTWERWDSMLPDGSINPGDMTSFNHYALGAVADWMHGTIGGLAPATPGWRRIHVAPRPWREGGVTWAECAHETPHGLARVSWRLTDEDMLEVEVLVPEGCEAELDLPGCPVECLGSGTHVLTARMRESA